MSFSFSASSLVHLQGVHPKLVEIVNKALSYGVMDFAVSQGVRTQVYQNALYAQGRTTPGKIVTWRLDSKHLVQSDGYGHAVDLNPVPIDFNNIEAYKHLATLMLKAAMELEIQIVWGGHWPNHDVGATPDWDHYELP